MTTSHWTDISSRSRDSDPMAEPTVLEQTSGALRVQLHRHIDAPGCWFVSCFMGVSGKVIERQKLKPVDLAEAKKAAIAYVRFTAKALLACAELLQDDTSGELWTFGEKPKETKT